MRLLLSAGAVLAAGILCGFRAEPVQTASLDVWTHDLHHVTAECETITHGFGDHSPLRSWRMPLAAVVDQGIGRGESGNLVVNFRCKDGSDCITVGRGSRVTGAMAEHGVPARSNQEAQALTEALLILRAGCGVSEDT